MIANIRRLLADRRGSSIPAVGLGLIALLGLGALAVSTYQTAAQNNSSAHLRQLTLAVESRANHYAAELDANLAQPASTTTGRECSVNPGICTQILTVTPSLDGTAQTLRVQADSLDAATTITRDITIKASDVTHITALDDHGRPTWVETSEGHSFTVWGVASGSISKVTPDQMQGPTAGTQWVLATTNGGIDNTGQLWAYGPNSKCETGIGNATTSPLTPTKLSFGGVTVRSIVSGNGSTFFLDSSGQAWAVGDNTRGQLGIGSTTSTCTPTKIPNHRFVAISNAGATTFAIDTAGVLFAWGDGSNAQIGDGAGKSYNSPVQVPTTERFTAVATSGTNTYAISTTRRLWAWGSNTNGQLGYGTPGTASPTPKLVTLATQFTAIATGANTAYALDTTGKLWAWGVNTKGQVGDGTLTVRTVPTAVAASGVYTAIAAAGSRAFATDVNGRVWAWGDNTGATLGLPTPTVVTTPTQIPNLRTLSPLQLSPASTATALFDADNVLWSIGSGGAGLWPATLDATTPGTPIRMPRPDGFTAPTWK